MYPLCWWDSWTWVGLHLKWWVYITYMIRGNEGYTRWFCMWEVTMKVMLELIYLSLTQSAGYQGWIERTGVFEWAISHSLTHSPIIAQYLDFHTYPCALLEPEYSYLDMMSHVWWCWCSLVYRQIIFYLMLIFFKFVPLICLKAQQYIQYIHMLHDIRQNIIWEFCFNSMI